MLYLINHSLYLISDPTTVFIFIHYKYEYIINYNFQATKNRKILTLSCCQILTRYRFCDEHFAELYKGGVTLLACGWISALYRLFFYLVSPTFKFSRGHVNLSKSESTLTNLY